MVNENLGDKRPPVFALTPLLYDTYGSFKVREGRSRERSHERPGQIFRGVSVLMILISPVDMS